MTGGAYQYLVDVSGNRTHIVLPLSEYDALLSQLDGSQKPIPAERAATASPSATSAVATAATVEAASLSPSSAEEVFTYSLPRKGGRARGLWRYPTMVVLKGSTIAENEASAMPPDYRRLRQKLIDLGIIERMHGELTFTRDYAFENPSIAVCVVEGGSRDGYRSWKDSEGRTMSDLGYSR